MYSSTSGYSTAIYLISENTILKNASLQQMRTLRFQAYWKKLHVLVLECCSCARYHGEIVEYYNVLWGFPPL